MATDVELQDTIRVNDNVAIHIDNNDNDVICIDDDADFARERTPPLDNTASHVSTSLPSEYPNSPEPMSLLETDLQQIYRKSQQHPQSKLDAKNSLATGIVQNFVMTPPKPRLVGVQISDKTNRSDIVSDVERQKIEENLRAERFKQADVFLSKLGMSSNSPRKKQKQQQLHDGHETMKTKSNKDSEQRENSPNEFKPETLEQKLKNLSKEQRNLISLIDQKRNVFITGSAGTGKSYTLEVVISYLRSLGKNVGVTAPTGVAAILVKGVTLHSFASLGSGKFDVGKTITKILNNKDKTSMWKKLDVLVIDEISMVSHRLLEVVEYVARSVRGNYKSPFGGIQLVFSGDFFQLPPVPEAIILCPDCFSLKVQTFMHKFSEAICLKEDCHKIFDPRTLFAFESPIWARCEFEKVLLTKVFRQSDETFIEMLNRVRVGNYTEYDRQLLNQNCTRSLDSNLVVPTRLVPTKKLTTEINQYFFGQLNEGVVHTYDKEDFASDEISRELLPMMNSYTQALEKINLRVGTQVMLITNLSTAEGLVNGSRGVVVDFDFAKDDQGRPDFNGQQLPVVVFVSGAQKTIKPCKFEIEFSEKSIMYREQLPLILGWAITIHKSQGVSLDCASIDVRTSFTEGQVYVALSRVRSLQGLHVVASANGDAIPQGKIRASQKVKDFYAIKDHITKQSNKDFWKSSIVTSIWSHFTNIGEEMDDPVEHFLEHAKNSYMEFLEQKKKEINEDLRTKNLEKDETDMEFDESEEFWGKCELLASQAELKKIL